MSLIKLNEILTPETNLIEIYILNEKITNEFKINIINNDFLLSKIQKKYKISKTNKYISYYHNEYIYTYDLTDDNQFVVSKLHINQKLDDKYYLISYNDSKVANHIFPCTNNISHISEYIINDYKITNRISLIIKEEDKNNIIYLQYNHSPNVDILKIEQILNETIEYLIK